MPSNKAVALFSGGMDSTTLLWWLREQGVGVIPLCVDYNQRHRKELDQAKMICELGGFQQPLLADLHNINHLLAKGSQSGREPVPEGHYAEESMKATVVPNRNMIMLSIAVGAAITLGCERVFYAAHSGDHAIYPDCRPEFINALNEAVRIGNEWTPVRLYSPFIKISKASIVTLGADLKVPFQHTWSCYKGEALHCGKCGTCVERHEAFQIAEVEDPTEYEKDD